MLYIERYLQVLPEGVDPSANEIRVPLFTLFLLDLQTQYHIYVTRILRFIALCDLSSIAAPR